MVYHAILVSGVEQSYSHVKEYRASLVTKMVKNLPTMLETQAQSLGQEDPQEKEMATHSSILA